LYTLQFPEAKKQVSLPQESVSCQKQTQQHAGIDAWSAHCRSQLSEAEEQSSVLVEQQEGAEDLVRALRHELHSLRQDTNSVAANARQTISEKEALQVCSRLQRHPN